MIVMSMFAPIMYPPANVLVNFTVSLIRFFFFTAIFKVNRQINFLNKLKESRDFVTLLYPPYYLIRTLLFRILAAKIRNNISEIDVDGT